MEDASTRAATDSRLSPASLRVLILLAFSIFINYVDRGNFSITAPFLKDELHLSFTQVGFLLSAFLWPYTLCQLPAGWLIDRFNVNWILGLGFLLWSAATTMTGLLHGFVALVATRLLLGVAECVAYPAYGKVLARHFPEHQRGIANAFIAVGQSSGIAFASFGGAIIIGLLGWRPFFVTLGFICLPWLLGWVRWAPPDKPLALEFGQSSYGIWDVVKKASAWGTGLGFSCANYLLYVLITWLPFYLVQERHYSLIVAGEIAGAVFLFKAISALISGRLSDHWISSGMSPTVARKALLCAALTLSGSLLLLAVLVPNRICVALLLAASTCLGLGSPHYYAVSQSLAGPRIAATWTSFQMLIGSLGSMLGPLVTGLVVQRTGGFVLAFGIAAAAGWAGALCWLFMVGPIRPVVWAPVEAELAAET